MNPELFRGYSKELEVWAIGSLVVDPSGDCFIKLEKSKEGRMISVQCDTICHFVGTDINSNRVFTEDLLIRAEGPKDLFLITTNKLGHVILTDLVGERKKEKEAIFGINIRNPKQLSAFKKFGNRFGIDSDDGSFIDGSELE